MVCRYSSNYVIKSYYLKLSKYLRSAAFFRCISAFSMPYAVLPLTFIDISVSVGVFSLAVLQIILVFSIIFSSGFLKRSKSGHFIDGFILGFGQ